VKKNLQRTFDSWEPDDFADESPVGAVRSRLLFILASFHAIIQERRTYIPQGWTKFYEFSYGDIRAGSFVMKAVSSALQRGSASHNSTGIDWETIYGLMEDAIYGGRVDNVYDMRVLRTYLSMFFNDKNASDSGAGIEIVPGTSLRMPNHTDYESFKKVLSQMPDADGPFVFCLPDNIERSLQRVTSSAVIRTLRALSASDAEANKFDREKWRVQVHIMSLHHAHKYAYICTPKFVCQR
jgi:dynein heavy chain 2